MTCTAPAAIPNGYFVRAKVTYAVNDIIQYVCDNHYVMSGSPGIFVIQQEYGFLLRKVPCPNVLYHIFLMVSNF